MLTPVSSRKRSLVIANLSSGRMPKSILIKSSKVSQTGLLSSWFCSRAFLISVDP